MYGGKLTGLGHRARVDGVDDIECHLVEEKPTHERIRHLSLDPLVDHRIALQEEHGNLWTQ
jgi:hypothetical protein